MSFYEPSDPVEHPVGRGAWLAYKVNASTGLAFFVSTQKKSRAQQQPAAACPQNRSRLLVTRARGWGGPKLLQSYEAERRLVGAIPRQIFGRLPDTKSRPKPTRREPVPVPNPRLRSSSRGRTCAA